MECETICLNLACRKSFNMPVKTAILCVLSGRAVLHLIHAQFNARNTSAVVLTSYVLTNRGMQIATQKPYKHIADLALKPEHTVALRNSSSYMNVPYNF